MLVDSSRKTLRSQIYDDTSWFISQVHLAANELRDVRILVNGYTN